MVRILIERHLKEDKRGDLVPLLRECRAAAKHYPGFITGETLVNTEDSSIITVICTWHSLEEWTAWYKSELRIKLEREIEPLLLEKPKVSTHQVMAAEQKVG